MSALAQSKVTQPIRQARMSLISRKPRRNFKVLTMLGGSLAGLIFVNLILGIIIQNNDYQLSRLIKEQESLAIQTDVISSKYNSLSSNQNLVNVAHSLGMVSNVNPVFLKLSDGTIIGQPKRALANQRSVAPNLVPNAALTTSTDTKNLNLNNSPSVLGSNRSTTVVASGPEDTIQASPTN